MSPKFLFLTLKVSQAGHIWKTLEHQNGEKGCVEGRRVFDALVSVLCRQNVGELVPGL